jgi:uncharacterized membrane protein
MAVYCYEGEQLKKLHAISLAVLFAIIMGFVSIILLYNSYRATGYDLGIFIQVLKNTLNGQIMYSQLTGYSQLAFHSSPILFVLVPIYWLFHYPQTLLIVQVLCLGFGGYLVYVIAQKFKLSHGMSLFVEFLFFINPLVWGIVLFDFHEICFAVPFILLMLIAYMDKKWIMYFIFMVLSLLIKEDITATIVVFGISMLVFDYVKYKKFNRIALITVVAGIFAYLLGVFVSLEFSKGEFPRILTYASIRYGYVKQSSMIISGLKTFFDSYSILLILAYLLPLGFLIFGGWQYGIVGLFILAMNMASTDAGQHTRVQQTAAGAIPYLFVAFIITLSKIDFKKNKTMVCSFLVMMAMIVMISPVSRLHLVMLPSTHDENVNKVLAMIPNGASVTTTNNIIDHIACRTDAYLGKWDSEIPSIGGEQWGYPYIETQYLVADDKLSEGESTWNNDVDNGSPDYTLVYQLDSCKLYQLRSDVK